MKKVMEKYEKPDMEIVELTNEVILTSSVCGGAGENEGTADSGDCENDYFA